MFPSGELLHGRLGVLLILLHLLSLRSLQPTMIVTRSSHDVNGDDERVRCRSSRSTCGKRPWRHLRRTLPSRAWDDTAGRSGGMLDELLVSRASVLGLAVVMLMKAMKATVAAPLRRPRATRRTVTRTRTMKTTRWLSSRRNGEEDTGETAPEHRLPSEVARPIRLLGPRV